MSGELRAYIYKKISLLYQLGFSNVTEDKFSKVTNELQVDRIARDIILNA